jgi:hypothetical protein
VIKSPHTTLIMPEPEVAMGVLTVNILPVATDHYVFEHEGKTYEIVDAAEAARRNPLLELSVNEPTAPLVEESRVDESRVDLEPNQSANVVALRVEPDPGVHWSVPRSRRDDWP